MSITDLCSTTLQVESDWVWPGRAQKQDENGFTLVNFSKSRQHDEPFILASQAQQVFYVEDPVEKGWHVVVSEKARDSYDMNPILSLNGEVFHQSDNLLDDVNEQPTWVREEVEGTLL